MEKKCINCEHLVNNDDIKNICFFLPGNIPIIYPEEHYCDFGFKEKEKPKGFEVGKYYKFTGYGLEDDAYFKPEKIDGIHAKGEYLNKNDYDAMTTIDARFANKWQEISEAEYEAAVAPHRPKLLVIEAGNAYEYLNGALVYVVSTETIKNEKYICGDCFDYNSNLFETYMENSDLRCTDKIIKNIPLSEWFERTSKHNPGFQSGGYYKDIFNCFVHIVSDSFNGNFPSKTITNEIIGYCPGWNDSEFYERKFLPITKAQWDARLEEMSK